MKLSNSLVFALLAVSTNAFQLTSLSQVKPRLVRVPNSYSLLPRHDSDMAPEPKHSESADSMDSMHQQADHGNSSMVPSPMSMHVSHLHHSWKTILDNPDLEPQQRAYWEQYNTTNFLSAPNTPNKFFLRSHIALTIVAWVFYTPLAVLVSGIPGTLLYLPLQTLQTATGLLGLFV